MSDEKLCALIEAFTDYYWSVSKRFVMTKIKEWHPEVTAEQLERVLTRCNAGNMPCHFSVETEGLAEPEIVTEHLTAIDMQDFDQFIAARIDAPFFDCDEETLLQFNDGHPDIPEARAIMQFGRMELGLDDEWGRQLVHDCAFLQPTALYEGESWVMAVLRSEDFGKIHFKTIEQVRRFRALGNRFYQAMPNPVLRGWKPSEIDNPPALLDDIPERDEDIPDGRPMRDQYLAALDAYMKHQSQRSAEPVPKRKIGANDPCPCGSGKKYKKCCGR